MIYFLWLGLFFLTSSWLYLTNAILPSDPLGYILLLAGLSSMGFGFYKSFVLKFNKKLYLILIPMAACIAIIVHPYNIGFIIIFISLLFRLLFEKYSTIIKIFNGMFTGGIVLVFQTLFFPLYYWLAPHYHFTQLFSPVLLFLLKIAGYASSWKGNFILIQTSEKIVNLSTTVEKFGIDFIILFFIGAIILFLQFASDRKLISIVKITIFTFFFLVLRVLFLIAIYLFLNDLGVFWNRVMTIISFVPLIFIFKYYINLDIKNSLSIEISLIKKQKRILLFFILGGLLFSSGWLFQDPGKKKHGNIIVDEKHSNWEWTDQKFDTLKYGEKSCYNYYCMFDCLSHYYKKVDRNYEEITSATLSKYDILILKTPTSPYSKIEIKAISDFVKGGGGLFLIGDHTNVFGSSYYLNPVANEFGLNYNYDATYDMVTSSLTFYKPNSILSHPVVQNMDFFLFGTSCTLSSELRSENIIVGNEMKVLSADYSMKNFFSQVTESEAMTYGLFIQMAGVKTGKGRVLGFTDSTVFSNFWIYMPGKPQLLLGSIEWLNRQNQFAYLKYIFLILGFCLILYSFYQQIILNRTAWLVSILFSLSLGVITGILGMHLLNKINYQLPEPIKQCTSISFDLQHSNIQLPDKKLADDAYSSYQTFFVWMQRLGFVPEIDYSLKTKTTEHHLICIINADKQFTGKQLSDLVMFIKKGGRVMIMDNVMNSASTSNSLLNYFNMKYEKVYLNLPINYVKGKIMISDSQPFLSITGGNPLFLNENGYPIICISKIGSGYILAVSDAVLFSDGFMGSTNMFPNAGQENIYRLQYTLLEGLLKNETIN